MLLPIAPFTETSGTYVNAEGRVQSFNGAVKPAGDTRPGWKVLRVLGNLLGVSGFGYESSEQVRAEALSVADGFVAGGNPPDQFAQQIKDEMGRWEKVIKQAGIKAE